MLFEHHQEMLEKHTEKLSELTEMSNITEEVKTHIVNLTRVTERFMSSVLNHIMSDDDYIYDNSASGKVKIGMDAEADEATESSGKANAREKSEDAKTSNETKRSKRQHK